MLRKSFFNPFSALLLTLAILALFIDVLPRPQGEADIFALVVLFLMWFVGGLVRLFYEEEAKRTFERHMSRKTMARHLGCTSITAHMPNTVSARETSAATSLNANQLSQAPANRESHSAC